MDPFATIPYLPAAIRFLYSQSICLLLPVSFSPSLNRWERILLPFYHPSIMPLTLPPTHVEIDE